MTRTQRVARSSRTERCFMAPILRHDRGVSERIASLGGKARLIKYSFPLLAGGLVLFLILAPGPAGADIVQPVSVQLREQEPNTFLVQWQVPQTYPVRAMPEPVLPEDCQHQGERLLQERPGTWLNRQVFRCADGVAGREIGVRYPFVTAGQSTMIRIELLSGEQLVHALNPGEDAWSVPEIDAGLMADLWSNTRRAVLDGVRHFFGGWLHLGFWLALALLRADRPSSHQVTAFTAGQTLAVGLYVVLGLGLPAALAESGIAVAVVLLINQSLRPASERRQLMALSATAGLIHGSGLAALMPAPTAFASSEWLYLLLAVLGMDATLLILVMVAFGVQRLVRGETLGRVLARGLAYGLGAAGVAAALVLVLTNPFLAAEGAGNGSRLPTLPGSETNAGMAGSRRVAAQGVQTPIQSFLSIEAFEVRHQILVRLRDVASELSLETIDTLVVEAQPEIKALLQEMVMPLAAVKIDSELAQPIVDRIDFLTVDTQGVLPRPEPVPEALDEAFLGITLVYLTPKTPQSVALTWNTFLTDIPGIPATVSDPEFSQTATLTAENPELGWQNNLSVDPVPRVAAVDIEPRVLPFPIMALPLLVTAGFLLVAVMRGRRSAAGVAWARIALAMALVVAPIGEIAIGLPASFGTVPSEGEARRILAGVLPNVYRAFEFREESDAYDRLSVSVTGETLSEVYLEHRRALEMEERGGARARVEAVEVEEVRTVTPVPGGGFDAAAVWVVGGTVTHFGHRHFRQNRYDARVSLVPVENTWKIRAIELLDEERIR